MQGVRGWGGCGVVRGGRKPEQVTGEDEIGGTAEGEDRVGGYG